MHSDATKIPLKQHFLLILTTIILKESSGSQHAIVPKTTATSSQPLILTPFVNQGKYNEAEQAAKVDLSAILSGVSEQQSESPLHGALQAPARIAVPTVPHIQARHKNIESFSGFFTVNPKHNSNLFFWFFPAVENPLKAPVLLYLDGGPGLPSSTEAFLSGPLDLDEHLKVRRRTKFSWTEKHSVIYIDSPVGTGFSFTGDNHGYSRNDNEIVENLHEALLQFFKVFSTYKLQPFYIAGHSYSGKISARLAKKIHDHQQQDDNGVRINLKGVLLLSPLLDPLAQISRASVLHTFGFVDEETRDHLLILEKIASEKAITKDFLTAIALIDAMYGVFSNKSSIFNQKTGYESIFDGALSPKEFPRRLAPRQIINSREFRNALHVGNSENKKDRISFGVQTPQVINALIPGFFESCKSALEALLWTKENYHVMILSGQMDISITWVSLESFVAHLNWANIQIFLKTERKIMRTMTEDKEHGLNQNGSMIAGYYKEFHNMFQGVIRLAGHHLSFDQPEFLLTFLTRLTHTHI